MLWSFMVVVEEGVCGGWDATRSLQGFMVEAPHVRCEGLRVLFGRSSRIPRMWLVLLSEQMNGSVDCRWVCTGGSWRNLENLIVQKMRKQACSRGGTDVLFSASIVLQERRWRRSPARHAYIAQCPFHPPLWKCAELPIPDPRVLDDDAGLRRRGSGKRGRLDYQ